MATAQMSRRVQSQQGTWSSIFPPEQVTETQSALFVKKLLAISVSSITYLRTIFPEHAFGDRCLEDLNLKILKDDSACPGACQVINWVKGCFDALDKKYLRMVVIAIYENPDDPETIIESYTFKFFYGKDGVDIYRNGNKLAGAFTELETKKATIRLLRTLVLLSQTLKSLPDDVMMTMKLYYYDEATPTSYQPPGFTNSSAEKDFQFLEEPVNIKVGDVATQFHTLKLRIKTDAQQFDMKEEETEKEKKDISKPTLKPEHKPSDEAEMDTTLEELPDQEEESSSDNEEPIEELVVKNEEETIINKPSQCEMECDAVPTENPELPCEQASTNPGLKDEGMSQADDDPKVRCPCDCNEDDGLMVLCGICDYWQHGICFGIIQENEAPALHICVICAKDPNSEKACTDPKLVNLDPVELQGSCLLRRALLACTETTRIIPHLFARRLGVETNVARGLINRLEREGFLRQGAKGRRHIKVVVKEKFKNNGLRKSFDEALYSSKKNISTTSESPTKSLKEMKKEEKMSIEKIVHKAAELNISGKQKNHSSKEKGIKTASDDTNSQVITRGTKRAVSHVDETAEFEISDSQCEVSERDGRPKRRKASIAVRPILV